WGVISKRKRRMQTTISSERAIHLMSFEGDMPSRGYSPKRDANIGRPVCESHQQHPPRRIDAWQTTYFLDNGREERRVGCGPHVARAATALNVETSRHQGTSDTAETAPPPGQQQAYLVALHIIERRSTDRRGQRARVDHQGSACPSTAHPTCESGQSSTRGAVQHAADV